MGRKGQTGFDVVGGNLFGGDGYCTSDAKRKGFTKTELTIPYHWTGLTCDGERSDGQGKRRGERIVLAGSKGSFTDKNGVGGGGGQVQHYGCHEQTRALSRH